jgi:sigma-B regulation protein RsbU (phosphoserine phosphatase)
VSLGLDSWHLRDLARARKIQQGFLPAIRLQRGNLRVVAEYRPAFAVGGDFYDVVYLPDGRVTALIGDVSGKGVTAALIMARVSTELRRLAAQKLSPRNILERVDEWFAQDPINESFVTVACVQLQPAHGRWVVSNAAHIVPLLRRRGGSVVRLSEPSGTPLGVGLSTGARYDEEHFAAEPGDTVVLVTDGLLTPARGPAGTDELRVHRKLTAAREDMDVLRRSLFRGLTSRRRDDATLLALQLCDAA